MDLDQLSRRERQLMELFFRKGELTAKQVQDGLVDPPSYATVRTLLRILEEKDYLQHTKSGRQFVYQIKSQPEQLKYQRLHKLLKTFFGGSITEAVATFINDPASKLSQEQLDELAQMIKKSKPHDLDQSGDKIK